MSKTKLTVSIDQELIPTAKRYARSHGLSLSQVIENALWEMGAGETRLEADSWSIHGPSLNYRGGHRTLLRELEPSE